MVKHPKVQEHGSGHGEPNLILIGSGLNTSSMVSSTSLTRRIFFKFEWATMGSTSTI